MPRYQPRRIPKDWRALLRDIPGGYDPITTADKGMVFDTDVAQLWLDFFPNCIVHTKGELAGQPVVLEHWQRAIIANAYGWLRPDDSGRMIRRYTECLVFIPRKNGKTTLLSGIVIGTLVLDHEIGAECYSAAGDRDQAALIYQQCEAMVSMEPELDSRMQVYKTTKSITYPQTNSFYRAISAEAHSKHGYNPHLVVVDELHTQPNAELVDVLNTGKGARLQPITWYITTSDYERPGSICNEIHEYGSKVRDGIIEDPTFLPVIYEARREDDWTSEKTWQKANPNYGISIKKDFLAKECKKAQESPRFENTFKRLYLNIRTEQAVRWLSMEHWDACKSPPRLWPGRTCYGGLDLATTTDLAALALIFPPDEDNDDLWSLLIRFWVPADSIRRRSREDRVPYDVWAQQSLIKPTDGNVIDYDQIEHDVMELAEEYDLASLAIDRWNASQLTNHLMDEEIPVVAFGQGFRDMSAPTKELERLSMAHQLRHGGHAVLRWCASNVSTEEDPAGNIKPSKKRSSERIDGIVATIMAIGAANEQAEDDSSGYEDAKPILI